MTATTVKSSSSKHISQETKTCSQSPTSLMRSIDIAEHFESAACTANSRTSNLSSFIADSEFGDKNYRSSVKETLKKFIRWRDDPDDSNCNATIHDLSVAVSTASAAISGPSHTVSPTLSKSSGDSAALAAADKKVITSCRPHYCSEENKATPDTDNKENTLSGYPSSKSKFIVSVRRFFNWGHGKKENELDTTDKVVIKNPISAFCIAPSELENPQVNPILRKRDTTKLVCSNSLQHRFSLPNELNEQNAPELNIKNFAKHRYRSLDFPESISPECIQMQKNSQEASRGLKRKLAAEVPSQNHARFSARNCDSKDGPEDVANTLCLKDSINPAISRFFSLNSAPREVPKVAAQLVLSSDERKVNAFNVSTSSTNFECLHDSPRLLSSNHEDERISTSRHNNENSIISSTNVSDFYPLKDPENSPYRKSVDDHEFLSEGTKPICNLDVQNKVDTMIASCEDYAKKSFCRTSSSDFVYDVDVHQNVEALVYAGETDKSPFDDSQTIDWHGNEVVSQKRNETHVTVAKHNGSAIYFGGIRDTSNDVRDINLIGHRNAGNEMLHGPRHSSYETVVHYDIPTAATTLPDNNEDFEISNLNLENAEQKSLFSNCGIDIALFKDFGSLLSNAKKTCTGCDGEDNSKTSAAKANSEAILTTLLDASVPYSNERDSNRGEFAKGSASQKFGTAILDNYGANISTNGDEGNNPKTAEYEITSHDEQFKHRLPTGIEKPNSPAIRNSVPLQASPVKVSRIGAYRIGPKVKTVTNTRWYGISPETESNADVEDPMVPYANNTSLQALSSFNNCSRMKDHHDSLLKASCNIAIPHEESSYPPSSYENIIHHIIGVKSNEVQQLSLDQGGTRNNVTKVDREPDHFSCREDSTEYGIIETGKYKFKHDENPPFNCEPGKEYGLEGNESPSFYLTSDSEARTTSSLAVNSLRDHEGSNKEHDEAAIFGASHEGNDADTDRSNSREGAEVDTPSPTPPPPQADRAETQATLLPREHHQSIFESVSPDSICFVHWPIVKENVVARVLGDYCPLRFRNNIRFDYDGSDFRVKQYYMTNRAILQEEYRTRRRVLFAPRPDKWFHFEEETEILDCLDDFIKVNKCLYPMFKGPRIVQRKHLFRRWKNRGRDRLIILEQLLQYWRQDPAYIEQLKREKELRRSSPLAYPQKPDHPPIKLVLHKIIERMTQDMAHKRLGRPPRAGSSVILLKKGPPLGIDYFGYKKQRAQEWVNNLLLKF
ncbi:(ZYRO0F04818g) [Zygosaccharomyces parabailii]|nr:(ZYRO0F04818g) [Zygosaccharomyces parabailii]CDH09709.1 uncharacterized protein ZBAI_01493 [Zygosaccharomyces bailii ISA1307]